MKKAFTITELLVAVALLAAVLSACGIIFNYSIDSQRTAGATAEIMRNLRAITDQLNADFAGLRKDGEIFVVWVAEPNSYKRFDRIMFFTTGDFQSYGTPVIRGNLARISYMIAKRNGMDVFGQAPEKRILARTQHIFTADTDFNNVNPAADWFGWNNWLEYDKTTMEQWKNILWNEKADMLSVITDVNVGGSTIDTDFRGADIDSSAQNSIHMLLCQGVGEFKIQGWYVAAAKERWVPEIDNGDFSGLGDNEVPGVLYPYPSNGMVRLGGVFNGNKYQNLLNEDNFDYIPGLGRALKFTITLYDSKGIIKTGKRFEHIVYIGK